MSALTSRIARKHVNVMDNVRDTRPVPVPAFTEIRRVDTDQTVNFVREKVRTTGAFWEKWNDLTFGDLTWLGRNECE